MHRTNNNRIPGGGMALARQDNRVKDVTKLSQAQLLEIKDREGKLLANKFKLNRLPDMGKRIKDFHGKVVDELERRANIDDATDMFSALNIGGVGKKLVNQLEWAPRVNQKDLLAVVETKGDVLDSDDEQELDPLRLIAERTMHERRVKLLPPERQLITAEDIAEISSFTVESLNSGLPTELQGESTQVVHTELVTIDVSEKLTNVKPKLEQILKQSFSKSSQRPGEEGSVLTEAEPEDLDKHVLYLVEKTELLPGPQREKFKPYKTTISNVHDPQKERLRKLGKHWEVTAATPPPIKHNGTQMITLLDSVQIQTEYLAKLKVEQEKQAANRLASKLERLEGRKMELPDPETLKTKVTFTTYRTAMPNLIEGDQRYDETDEVHDLLDEPKSSGVLTLPILE